MSERIQDEDFFIYAQRKAYSITHSKHIAPILESIATLPQPNAQYYSDDGIHIKLDSKANKPDMSRIIQVAKSLIPWRKGPFYIFDLHIDSEWQSFKKWQLIKPHIDITSKRVADIGCNNGYYMFEMLLDKPDSMVGFDPVGIFKAQFEFINHFANARINYELLGVEDLNSYCKAHKYRFDVIFCLGVLYHRYDPINTLKTLYRALNDEGELFLDSLIFESNDEICLCPEPRYAQMSNVYFIPSIKALQGWCKRAGFKECEILGIMATDSSEQRATKWTSKISLKDVVNQSNKRTIEGYQAPIRGYFKLKKQNLKKEHNNG